MTKYLKSSIKMAKYLFVVAYNLNNFSFQFQVPLKFRFLYPTSTILGSLKAGSHLSRNSAAQSVIKLFHQKTKKIKVEIITLGDI